MSNKSNVRLMIVGDEGVGKTTLLLAHLTDNHFPIELVPRVLGNTLLTENLNGRAHLFDLIDTDGRKPVAALRPPVDLYLVCFSCARPATFEHARTKWIPEILATNRNAKFILVATQTDLRAASDKNMMIETEQGLKMAKAVNARKYVECSSLGLTGLREVFVEAALEAAIGRGVPRGSFDTPNSRKKSKPKSKSANLGLLFSCLRKQMSFSLINK